MIAAENARWNFDERREIPANVAEKIWVNARIVLTQSPTDHSSQWPNGTRHLELRHGLKYTNGCLASISNVVILPSSLAAIG